MNKYDDTLLQLQQRVALKKQLEAKLGDLQKQRRIFDKKVNDLRAEYSSEQADVKKIEGRSLANYFYQIIGKLDEKLDEERTQAYAARVKLDAAERELAAVDCEIQEIKSQLLLELDGCEETYTAALERKRIEVKSSGTAAASEILEIEAKIALLESQKQEIREAVSAGRNALGTADSVLSQLQSADDWNTFDMFGGGGILTHVAKHSHLDEAQEKVEQLQGKLRQFKTELADINIQADIQISIDGFLSFADFFFDGLFVDWAIGDHISEALSSVQNVKSQVNSALNRLADLEATADSKICVLKSRVEELLIQA